MLSNYTKIKERNKEANAKDQLYSKLFSHPLSIGLVAIVENTKITPNILTSISFLFSLSAAFILLTIPEYKGLVLSWLCLHFALVFDSADGQLARWKGNGSPFGAYFDIFTDFLEQRLIIVILAIRLSWENEHAFLAALICLAVLTLKTAQPHMSTKALKQKNESETTTNKQNSTLKTLIGKIQIAIDGHYVFLALAFLTNRPMWYFYSITLWFGILIIKRFMMEYIALK